MRRTGALLETGKILISSGRTDPAESGPAAEDLRPGGAAGAGGEHCGIRHRAAADRPAAGRILWSWSQASAACAPRGWRGFGRCPGILLSVDEAQSGMVALVENLQRRDLDYIEEAEGLARLMRLYGLSQEQAAQRVGKSQSAVANKLRLLRHSPQVLALLRENQLSERHARALLRLPEEEDRLAVLQTVIRQQLNVAKTEAIYRRLSREKERAGAAEARHPQAHRAGCAAVPEQREPQPRARPQCGYPGRNEAGGDGSRDRPDHSPAQAGRMRTGALQGSGVLDAPCRTVVP